MQIDFSTVDDADSFITVPEGTYLCRIGEVREATTREGGAMWGLRWEVADGDHAGRTAVWDNLIWSDRGLPRVKRVLALLGFDVSGPLDIDAHDLMGRRAHVEVAFEEREDPLSGKRVTRARVPYRGYAPVDGEHGASGTNGEHGLGGTPF